MCFSLQKTNYTTDFTAEENDDNSVHVYLVATLAKVNKLDCRLAFSEVTLYWMLHEMRHITIATGLFLPGKDYFWKCSSDTDAGRYVVQ